MVETCSICNFNNPDDGRFCTWCGAPMEVKEIVVLQPPTAAPAATLPVAEQVKIEPTSQHLRVWLPSRVLAHDQWGECYPALEWQQYELTY